MCWLGTTQVRLCTYLVDFIADPFKVSFLLHGPQLALLNFLPQLAVDYLLLLELDLMQIGHQALLSEC